MSFTHPKHMQGRKFRISGKRAHAYKDVCVCGRGGVGGSLCWFYLIFLKHPMKVK